MIGVDVGRQTLIGGSLISGVDVLQQARRLVAVASVGARVQTSFGTVFGADLGIGLTDGSLALADPARSLSIRYRNRSQWHWNLMAGQALGGARRDLVYFYLSEVTRAFDVSIDAAGRPATQRDEQGLLRYGAGYERAVSGMLSVRGAVGSSRADFGGRPTNVAPRRLIEVMVGAVVTP